MSGRRLISRTALSGFRILGEEAAIAVEVIRPLMQDRTVKKFAWLLVFEILGVVVAMSAFRIFPDRLVAGAVAGGLFVLVGAVIFYLGVREKSFRKTITFGMGGIHLFFVALPMLATRFMNATLSFGEIRIWGLSGPEFHCLSGWVYWALMFGTVIDGILAWRRSYASAQAPK